MDNYTAYFEKQKYTRIGLLIFGTIITWLLLVNLLQVNFDLGVFSENQSNLMGTGKQAAQSTVTEHNFVHFENRMSPPAVHHYSISIKPDESLDSLFKKYHLDDKNLWQITQLPLYHNFASPLYINQKVTIESKNHHLEKLVYPLKDHKVIVFRSTDKGYKALIKTPHYTARAVYLQGSIKHSLYTAAHRAGLNSATISQLTTNFSSDIDFKKDLHKGDSFKVVVMEHYKHSKPIKSGVILAAQIKIGHKLYTAIRDMSPKGKSSYYTAYGINLQKAFLRAPIHYKFISSPFNLHRMHPILHIVRPHLGVDLAAPYGTPIHASSDGRIRFMGRLGGYGNVIIIQNNVKYSTRFAHMERFAKGMHRGKHVKEGEVIGYVGATGLATGPHLHYELRVYGKPVNPMTSKLPNAAPIAKTQRISFEHYAENLEQHYHFENKEIKH